MSLFGTTKQVDDDREVPPWMLTYADTITLLVTFFVMLMSFSTLEEEEFDRIRGSLTGYLGVAGDQAVKDDSLMLRRFLAGSRIHIQGYENPPDYDPLSYVEERFEVRVSATSVANLLRYELTEKGFEIHVLPGALFEEESDRITPEGRKLLATIGQVCRFMPHTLRVRAWSEEFFYPGRRFRTRADLAAARARELCRTLEEEGGVPAPRIEAAISPEPDDMILDRAGLSQVSIAILRPVKRRVSS